MLTEFAIQHGFPHALKHLVACEFSHPGIGGRFFQWFPILGKTQIEPHQPKTDLVDAPTQAGVHDSRRDGIKGVKLAVVVHHADGFGEHDLVRPAQLFNQTQKVRIALEPMMIKSLHRPIPFRFFETGSQTARKVASLKNGDIMPGISQI